MELNVYLTADGQPSEEMTQVMGAPGLYVNKAGNLITAPTPPQSQGWEGDEFDLVKLAFDITVSPQRRVIKGWGWRIRAREYPADGKTTGVSRYRKAHYWWDNGGYKKYKRWGWAWSRETALAEARRACEKVNVDRVRAARRDRDRSQATVQETY